MVGLEFVVEETSDSVEHMPEYNVYSNQRYMEESRKNNFMLSSLIDYFILFVPFTLVSVFLINRLFYLLFDYKISQWMRPYSFWFILLELLIQNNLEYFTFLGMRTLETMMSFSFSSKSLNGFFILFLFVVFATTCTSYLFYLHR